MEHKIDEQLDTLLTYPDVGLVYSDFHLMTNGRDDALKIQCNTFCYEDGNVLVDYFIREGPLATSSIIVNKKVFDEVGTFDPGLPVAQDTDMWLRIAGEFRLHKIPDSLIYKRDRRDSLAADRPEKSKYLMRVVDNIVSLYPELNPYAKYRYARIYNSLNIYYINRGRRLKAVKFAFRALRYNMKNVRYHMYVLLSIMPVPLHYIKRMMVRLRKINQRYRSQTKQS
jgi:hypothetical protein